MASCSGTDFEFVTLSCTEPNPIGNDEASISTKDIHSWDLPALLRCKIVKIQVHRDRLVEDSSFFTGLLGGSFRESKLSCVSIQWNMASFINILKCVYGFPVNATSKNFLSLFEDALYFGSKSLLSNCKTWFYKVASSKDFELLELDDLINIWNFGTEHANDFIPELCVFYLARNFMWAISSKFFVAVPYDLLIRCIKHPHLTIHSEMDLSDALLVWLHANSNREQMEQLNNIEDHPSSMLKQIRACLLPLWFVAGKRRCCYFSKLAEEGIETIFRLMKIPPPESISIFENGDLEQIRIRLTKYSKIVNLSGCPQVTSVILLLTLLPSEYFVDPTFMKSIEQSLINFENLSRHQIRSETLYGLQPTLSFEEVEELNISKCPRLHFRSAIELLSKSFPSLKKLKAGYLLNIKSRDVFTLMQKFPLISEIDIIVDVTPLIPAQVTVGSSSLPVVQPVSNKSPFGDNDVFDGGSNFIRPSLSIMTRLIFEGRSDVSDLELRCVADRCASLQYLNIKGCKYVTDVGISFLIRKCLRLHSLVVCDTSFGIHSIQALCSLSTYVGSSDSEYTKGSFSMASKLQKLHIGGCKGVNEKSLVDILSKTQTLKRLCLRGTNLVDKALWSFSGSSLEALDVSETMISQDALAHIVNANTALKCLMAKGCKNLCQLGGNNSGAELSSAYLHRDLFSVLGEKCKLEKIAIGWGISHLSLDILRPSISSLRELQIGLGGSVGEDALRQLPETCPMLESLVLHFQVVSDAIMMNIIILRHLRALALCYCFGDISMTSFRNRLLNLANLRLERVTPWMTNHDLDVLTHSFPNLVEFSLVGCRLLDSDSLRIISNGWPGLKSIHLEDCGEATKNSVSCLYNCRALEDILLRHNGAGIHCSFVIDAASELPMLRRLSLDTCDASEGEFEIPSHSNRGFLSTVTIARCMLQKSDSNGYFKESHRRAVHKDTLVVEFNCKVPTTTVVKERL